MNEWVSRSHLQERNPSDHSSRMAVVVVTWGAEGGEEGTEDFQQRGRWGGPRRGDGDDGEDDGGIVEVESLWLDGD